MAQLPYTANLSFSSRSSSKTMNGSFIDHVSAIKWATTAIDEMTAKGYKLEVFQVTRH